MKTKTLNLQMNKTSHPPFNHTITQPPINNTSIQNDHNLHF